MHYYYVEMHRIYYWIGNDLYIYHWPISDDSSMGGVR